MIEEEKEWMMLNYTQKKRKRDKQGDGAPRCAHLGPRHLSCCIRWW